MLKNIPSNLSPELVSIMMKMGHGDELVIGDGNFPGHALNDCVVRADGQGVEALLDSILTLLPLDPYSDWQVGLMSTVEGDPTPTIWKSYNDILSNRADDYNIRYFERFEFYEQTRDAFAVVISSETALYGNIILKKGVV